MAVRAGEPVRDDLAVVSSRGPRSPSPPNAGPRAVPETIDEAGLWSLVDAAPDGIVLVDEAGRIELANRQMEETFGFVRGDLLGRLVEDLIPGRFRDTHQAHRARYGDEPANRPMGAGASLNGLRADGTELPVEISLSPVATERGMRIVAVVRDISGRLETEARFRRAEAELRVLEDRERMARDLHDVVIQRLFAAGMAAQSLHSRLTEPGLAARAAAVVDELDRTIREIRTVIFGLETPIGSRDGGLRGQILAVVEDERPALGLRPEVRFDGPVETAADETAREVLAILREALSNVARHALATAVEVHVRADDELVLCISDNGVGLRSDPSAAPEPGSGNGLRNMSDRARALGGSMTIVAGSRGGTTVECRLPLDARGGR